ncbi:hypothetical protein [Coleofasciculus sp. FACHB-1120]|nr:hypothetical protein [Coleofasciculus sp. FACHB-1120]MBD2742049.1 hypothetical protein [Coleofasciculus sp. FACHB-1120]
MLWLGKAIALDLCSGELGMRSQYLCCGGECDHASVILLLWNAIAV